MLKARLRVTLGRNLAMDLWEMKNCSRLRELSNTQSLDLTIFNMWPV
jgi:hypothetical protein